MRRLRILLPTLALALMPALLPAGVLAADTPPAAAPVPTGMQVRFAGSGGIPLAGTLTLPDAAAFPAPVPAVLLLQGSGPTDRDGNQPENGLRTDLLRRIADLLAGTGIASLRYDKRGLHANGATLPADRRQYPVFFSWQGFVGDALAARAFLAGQPGIAPGRVALLGHSEGGLIALAAATSLQRQGLTPAALVLAATPGRPLGGIIEDQIRRILQMQNATPEQERFVLSANSRIITEIQATGRVPDTVPPGLAVFYPPYAGPYMKAVMAFDPAAAARFYAGPVLLLQGAADVQVSATADALALDAALLKRGHDDHRLLIAPQVSHNLKDVRDETEPGLEGPLNAAIAAQLADWLAVRLRP
ncbi:thioesterase domain-containing protein [Ferrovibrio sp.]|uniref:alpha/beta hydrolase n=1 Tax=Ferrovibrio sp. TaxID=1917215 RepID=UPI00311EF0A9